MKIYRAIKNNVRSQRFGESRSCVKFNSSGQVIRPFDVITKTTFTCPIGYVDFYSEVLRMKGHNGEDWATYYGDPIYFNIEANTRWWARTEVDPDGGVGLDVISVDPIPFTREELPKEMTTHSLSYWENQDGKLHIMARFWHLKDVNLSGKPLVQVGTFADGMPQMKPEIKFGDLIAFADNTGASSGNHLHFATKFVAKNGMTIGNDNGYTGAVDLTKFFENSFVGDKITVEERAMSAIDYAKEVIRLVEAYILSRKGR